MTSKIVITGGSGFIGSHLVEYLLRERPGIRIIVLDRVPPPAAVGPLVEFISLDINDALAVDSCSLPDFCDIIHLAALCKEPGYAWEDYFRTNYLGTRNVLALADRIRSRNLIFASTMMVFKAGDRRNCEEDLAAPDTAYGMSKLLAEIEITGWARATGARVRIIRPGVVFGRGENGNFLRLYHALKGRRFVYVGRKSTIKGCIYVKDLVRLVAMLMSDRGERTTYNAVYPEAKTIAEIVVAFQRVFGFSHWIPTVPYRLALLASTPFPILDAMGMTNGIHPRRIQKLYYSTDISADHLNEIGFYVDFHIEAALSDWKKDCSPNEIW